MSLGTRLKMLRKQVGLSQERLGDLVDVHVNTVRRWENGSRSPDAEVLQKLAQILGTTTSYLLEETANLEREQKAEGEKLKFAINIQPSNVDDVESAVSALKLLYSSGKVFQERTRGEKGEINEQPYDMGRSGVVYSPEPAKGMEFWGSVLDAADAAADRADAREISIIIPLIHEAYNTLLTAQKSYLLHFLNEMASVYSSIPTRRSCMGILPLSVGMGDRWCGA